MYEFRILGFPQVALVVENLPANAGDTIDAGSIPGGGRSPGEGSGSPPQSSCLENPMDRGALQATVHEVSRVGHDLVTKPRQNPQIERKYLQAMRPRMG